MTEHWLTYLGLGLSTAAFAQFWVWLYLRRRDGRGRLSFVELGTPEIGFDADGPQVALLGSLRAQGGDVVVRSMELVLTHKKARQSRRLQWLGFRPAAAPLPASAVPLLPPEDFGVSTLLPRRLHLVFHDFSVAKELRPLLHRYRQQWRDTQQRSAEKEQSKSPLADPSRLRPAPEAVNEFKRSPVCIQSYTELDKLCYWEHGEYHLLLRIIAGHPSPEVGREIEFSLSKADVKFLKANCVNLLDEPIAESLQREPGAYEQVYALAQGGWKPAAEGPAAEEPAGAS